MELIERVEQLERELKALRPDLHFPTTATLEHRLRWLEIVLEEIRARDNHGVYAETLDEEKLRKLLSHTVYIKEDRITLKSLTADPASCVAGDMWFRSDLGKSKLAVDTVVANAKLFPAAGAKVATGTYTGDNTTGRQITVGFQCSLVVIIGPYIGAEEEWTLVPGSAHSHSYGTTPWHRLCGSYNWIHATDGFVVSCESPDANYRGPNYSGTYRYTAISVP